MNEYERALNDMTMTAWANEKDYKLLEKLVIRATPKKCYFKDYEADGQCPSCFYHTDYTELKYCPDCGQALDWSNDNE